MLVADSPTDKGSGDYEVGHGKPPKHTQFGVPGTGNTPNRTGKPKGAISIKAAIRRRVRDRKLAERLADQAIDLALAQDAKVQDVIALGSFHDEGMDVTPSEVEAAPQNHTPEQMRMAIITWHRLQGHDDIADRLEKEATDGSDEES